MTPGHIYSVALNDQGTGIIGGNISAVSFAGFVTSENTFLNISPLPIEAGSNVNSVAINHSGLGLVGGYDESGNAYGALAQSYGTASLVFESPFPGTITSVALNDSATGLLGGQSGSDLYAAFFLPNRTIQPIDLGAIAGEINSVAISQAGVGLVGGFEGSNGYAALIAPNGAVTVLDVSGTETIYSVAMPGPHLAVPSVSSTTPQSSGPYLSAIYTQLVGAAALDFRFIEQNQIWAQSQNTQTAQIDLAHDEMNLACNDTQFASNGKSTAQKPKPAKPPKKNSIWLAPFGSYIHLKEQGAIPSYNNEIGGALLAYDHRGSNYLAGAAFGYAFNYVDYSQHLGHAKVQEEMLCFYGAYYRDHFRLNGALWGGLYQLSNVRHTLSFITSKGHTYGWILSPHLEMATPWAIDSRKRYRIEPFFMLDWVNSWQNHFTESGDAGMNLVVGNIYGSLLQSELGCRFYERFEYQWGTFSLEEKLSYVNQAPFHFNSVTTAFVSSASTFPVAVGSTKIENLGAFQITGSFNPRNQAYPFGGLSFETMLGSSYQSYFLSLFCGMNF